MQTSKFANNEAKIQKIVQRNIKYRINAQKYY